MDKDNSYSVEASKAIRLLKNLDIAARELSSLWAEEQETCDTLLTPFYPVSILGSFDDVSSSITEWCRETDRLVDTLAKDKVVQKPLPHRTAMIEAYELVVAANIEASRRKLDEAKKLSKAHYKTKSKS